MMAAKLNKVTVASWWVAVAALLTTTPAATDGNSISAAQALVEKRLLESWAAYAEQIESCREGLPALEPELFEDIDVSDADLLTALTYFHNKTQNACYEDEARDWLVAVHLMRESGLADDVDEALDGDVSLTSTDLTFWWHEARAEAKYLMLDQEVRDQFEAIEQLDSRFHMRATIRELNLMPY